jgi:flagellar protein FliO/FliZ
MAVFVFASFSFAADIEKVRAFRDGDTFTTEMTAAGGWSVSDLQARFSGSIVEIDVPQASLSKGKHIIRPDDRLVRSVLVAPGEAGSVRAKIYLKDGFIAKSLEGGVHVRKAADNMIRIEINGDAEKGLVAKNDPDATATISVMSADATESIGIGAARLVADGSQSAASTGSVPASPGAIGDGPTNGPSDSNAVSAAGMGEKKIDTSKMPENEIPVLTSTKSAKKAEGGMMERVMITLGVLAVALGAAVFGLKRWATKSGAKNQNTKIKVLTQHMMGPKKSLAIVQVAGETILIGVTDHNISMLKTLSLLDEEIPEEVPRNFGTRLADFDEDEMLPPSVLKAKKEPRSRRMDDDSDAQEDFAMRGIAEIRDVVSTRLRGLKNL